MRPTAEKGKMRLRAEDWSPEMQTRPRSPLPPHKWLQPTPPWHEENEAAAARSKNSPDCDWRHLSRPRLRRLPQHRNVSENIPAGNERSRSDRRKRPSSKAMPEVT